jgi:hypothetical protein
LASKLIALLPATGRELIFFLHIAYLLIYEHTIRLDLH